MSPCAAEDPSASLESAHWHVWWRTGRGCVFFNDRQTCLRIRKLLLEAHARPGRVLVDFLVLPTEIHLLSLAHGEHGAAIARSIGHVVARWARAVSQTRGPVLAGASRARRIEGAQALREEVRMLAWRPVVLGTCATPSYHPHGGFRVAIGLSPAGGYSCEPLLRLFDPDRLRARTALREWASHRPSRQACQQWALDHGLTLATGGVGPIQHMAREVHGAAAAFVAAGGRGDVEGALQLLSVWAAVKFGIAPSEDLRISQHAASARARALVALLARRHLLCSAASVARYFGRAKSTLSERATAMRASAVARTALETPPRQIVEEALALLGHLSSP